MEGGTIAIVCCYQDRRGNKGRLHFLIRSLWHIPRALHWKEKNKRLALWIAHISESGRMRPALGSLTLLFITCAWRPLSALQPCGTVSTSTNTALPSSCHSPGLQGWQGGHSQRCEAGTYWDDKHICMACTAPTTFIPRLCFLRFVAEVKHKSVVDRRQDGTLWENFYHDLEGRLWENIQVSPVEMTESVIFSEGRKFSVVTGY